MSVVEIRRLAHAAIDADLAYQSSDVRIDWEFYNAVIDLTDDWEESTAALRDAADSGRAPDSRSPERGA